MISIPRNNISNDLKDEVSVIPQRIKKISAKYSA